MPVLDSSRGRVRETAMDRRGNSGQPITIGLVNNMPEAAFKATQRQFFSLLNAASGDIPVRLLLYALPGLARTEHSGHSKYLSVETLWDQRLDGLIVTGREPVTPDLRDESYWDSFVQVLEWAQHNTISTVWSCLAAHAAVLHMDGIPRKKSDTKHCGIFDCVPEPGHWLAEGAPPRFQVAHSRWNSVAEADLAACGYQVVTRTREAQVDTFLKQGSSLFVFFQGHPEYESDTLLREYRRDVERYLNNQSDAYPSTPHNYFDDATERGLDELRQQAVVFRDKYLLADLATALARCKLQSTWDSTATVVYRNWLDFIYARKHQNTSGARLISQ